MHSQCCRMVCRRYKKCHHLPPPPKCPRSPIPLSIPPRRRHPQPQPLPQIPPLLRKRPVHRRRRRRNQSPALLPPKRRNLCRTAYPLHVSTQHQASTTKPKSGQQNKQREKENSRIFPLPPIPYPLNCRSLPFLARLSSSVSSTTPPIPNPSPVPSPCCPKAVKLILLRPLTPPPPPPSAVSTTLDSGGIPDTGLSPSSAPRPGEEGEGAGERLLTDTLFTRTNCPCTRTVWRLGVGGGRRCVVSGSGSGPLSKAKSKDEGAVVEVVVGRWKSRWGRGGAGRFGGLRERGERGGILFFGGVFGRG